MPGRLIRHADDTYPCVEKRSPAREPGTTIMSLARTLAGDDLVGRIGSVAVDRDAHWPFWIKIWVLRASNRRLAGITDIVPQSRGHQHGLLSGFLAVENV